ncbi:hypothetical protein EDC01DRAFT_629994 [Geopyxis carbonaria]|nr:hypothetical protein EDC01DRAFT_629994 [Geopyxis carbonaria]
MNAYPTVESKDETLANEILEGSLEDLAPYPLLRQNAWKHTVESDSGSDSDPEAKKQSDDYFDWIFGRRPGSSSETSYSDDEDGSPNDTSEILAMLGSKLFWSIFDELDEDGAKALWAFEGLRGPQIQSWQEALDELARFAPAFDKITPARFYYLSSRVYRERPQLPPPPEEMDDIDPTVDLKTIIQRQIQIIGDGSWRTNTMVLDPESILTPTPIPIIPIPLLEGWAFDSSETRLLEGPDIDEELGRSMEKITELHFKKLRKSAAWARRARKTRAIYVPGRMRMNSSKTQRDIADAGSQLSGARHVVFVVMVIFGNLAIASWTISAISTIVIVWQLHTADVE